MLLPAVAAGMMMMGGAQVEAAAPLPASAPAATVPVIPYTLMPRPAAATPPTTTQDDTAQDIVVTGEKGAPPGDPLEEVNAKSFEAVQSVDKAVIGPVAKAYNKGLPRPIRKGLRNFFLNLGEPVVFAAYLLQFKPGKALETAGRFGINTTLGLAGLFDIAKRKPFYLPYRPNGLSNTLGFYGIKPGPYMYLPLIGPTTLRDLIGDTVDNLILPTVVGAPFNKPSVVIPATILNQLGERAAFDETIREIRKEEDPYAVYRDLYLKQRQAEIDALHGRVPEEPVVPIYGKQLRTPGKKGAPKVVIPDPYDSPVTDQP